MSVFYKVFHYFQKLALGRNNDVLVCPDLMPGVALPFDGEECGETFVRPEPSRKRNVNVVVGGATG